jgi:hypothetical protein
LGMLMHGILLSEISQRVSGRVDSPKGLLADLLSCLKN